MVGCVIVCDDAIIGEGYTSRYGGPHAEINAIAQVNDMSLLNRATLYVTLEPCSHFGKTPPCVDAILKHGIPEVVIGLKDPHTRVAGKGLQRLTDSGCRITLGVLEKECRAHHKRFLTFHEKKRPYILLKWAESRDGFIAPERSKRGPLSEPFWITNTFSRQLVHQWRSEEQAIFVGTNTVLHDNPKLNTRLWYGKSPVRIVLDRNLKIRGEYHVLDGSVKTIIITEEADAGKLGKDLIYEAINFKKNVARQVCEVLHKHHIISVLVEGGSQTLKTFISEGLWDEARIFTGPALLKGGLDAPRITGKTINDLSIREDRLKILSND
jgi:diaminohydroxyphosphoribosylaminopyrimidine deaminase/5-amino-6-(5-phosphoribosylamino)uracil reductase